jgi:hypothetical protein
MSSKKEDKKSLGSSVASNIRDRETTEETKPHSVSSPKEEEK